MIDTPRGPTTEQLRARALADAPKFAIRVHGRGLVAHVNDEPLMTYEQAETAAVIIRETLGEECEVGPIERVVLYDRIAAALPRPCLACNREQGERMCDLCQRLELAEAAGAR